MKVYLLMVTENYSDFTKSDCTKVAGVFATLEKALELKNAFDNVKHMLSQDIETELTIEEREVRE